MKNQQIIIPTKNDKIEIRKKEDDGRKKRNKVVVRGAVVEDYTFHILIEHERTKVKESFMKKDFINKAIDFSFIS